MSDILCGLGEYSGFVELVCGCETFKILGVIVFFGTVRP
jgi:hypothetical protein